MAQDPYKYFRVEARELVEQLDREVLALEKQGAAGGVARMLRLAHTLKGAARVVRQREIAEAAHAVEDVLAPFRAGDASIPRAVVDTLLRRTALMRAQLELLSTPAPEARQAPSAAPASDSTLHTLRADVAEVDAVLEGLGELKVRLEALRSSRADTADVRQGLRLLARGRAGKGHDEVEALAARLEAAERGWTTGVEQLERELVQVRQAAERLRLLPVETLFTSLERTARDAARELGKQVEFSFSGAEVRIDAHALGVVQPALLQLVRNAVAHGAETPDQRRAAGKGPSAKVSVAVKARGRWVYFRCTDDGRGVDVEAVRSEAVRQGRSNADVRAMSPHEVSELLLRGGISTSARVTAVSGRGVGLDLVRQAAEQLGGRVEIERPAEGGAAFSLAVPLSVSSLEALWVESALGQALIPLNAVRGAVRVGPQDTVRTDRGEALRYAEQPLPFRPLARLLGGGVKGAAAPAAVVVAGRDGLAAVGVDRLLGVSVVVVRPLPALAVAAPCVAGASLDARGNPLPVLDPDALVTGAGVAMPPESAEPAPEWAVLVVDDSLTTRMLEKSILESAGYQVDVASSGEEGLEKARDGAYALFLVDVEMPGIDGFTFVERVRADPSLRDTPAILVTSRAGADDLLRAKSVGANGYVVKSEFNQSELLERIRGLVSA